MENSLEYRNVLEQITQEISLLDIAGYLKEEIRALSKYLHAYKLKNIWENIDTLKEYLYFLDDHSTKQLAQLDYEVVNADAVLEEHDISYYLSTQGIQEIGETKFCQKLAAHDPQVGYMMQSVKWFLLLTADEFCNATPTRLSITRMDRQKQYAEN